jgi:hypothetical protein
MLKTVLSFITNSSILLALFSFVFSFGLHSSWEEKTSYSIAIFFSVLGIYNFHRLYKFQKKQLNFLLSQWVAKNQRIIQLLSLVGILTSSILFIRLLNFNLGNSLLLSACLLISIFYVISNWREIPFLKAAFVALVWTVVLVILPSLLQDTFESQAWIFLLFFYALTIPADARDMETDLKKLNTLPQLIGKKLSFWVTLLLLSLFVLFYPFSLESKISLIVLNSSWVFIYQYLEGKQKISVEFMDALLLVYGVVFWIN